VCAGDFNSCFILYIDFFDYLNSMVTADMHTPYVLSNSLILDTKSNSSSQMSIFARFSLIVLYNLRKPHLLLIF